MFVTLTAFSTALADYYFGRNDSFNKKLSKSEAKDILNRQLFHYGINGEHPSGFFEAHERTDEYNEIYRQARIWVNKNYPYLNI